MGHQRVQPPACPRSAQHRGRAAQAFAASYSSLCGAAQTPITVARTREESGWFPLPSLMGTGFLLLIKNPGCKEQANKTEYLPTAEEHICLVPRSPIAARRSLGPSPRAGSRAVCEGRHPAAAASLRLNSPSAHPGAPAPASPAACPAAAGYQLLLTKTTLARLLGCPPAQAPGSCELLPEPLQQPGASRDPLGEGRPHTHLCWVLLGDGGVITGKHGSPRSVAPGKAVPAGQGVRRVAAFRGTAVARGADNRELRLGAP